MRIGVICPADIASRRFLPALQKDTSFEFAGVGMYSAEERFSGTNASKDEIQDKLSIERKKAEAITATFGGKIYDSYHSLIESDDVDAVYIPLPPALHYMWAKKTLENGKHVLVEKPSTLTEADTKELINIAHKNHLALHENYMFIFHKQLDAIEEIINSGEIGNIRLYRISFGFPMRAKNDFRYIKSLGGGSLIDAGGYTIRYATRLLGDTARIKYAQLNNIPGFEVDMYGSASMVNDSGVTAQLSFGMDNNYKCELEAWGSKGCLYTGRVLTAPSGFVPTVTIRKGNTNEDRELPADDAFLKSIQYFADCIENVSTRQDSYKNMERQAKYIDDFRKMATQ
jgi:NDP-hexose-3-ketoreductase